MWIPRVYTTATTPHDTKSPSMLFLLHSAFICTVPPVQYVSFTFGFYLHCTSCPAGPLNYSTSFLIHCAQKAQPASSAAVLESGAFGWGKHDEDQQTSPMRMGTRWVLRGVPLHLRNDVFFLFLHPPLAMMEMEVMDT